MSTRATAVPLECPCCGRAIVVLIRSAQERFVPAHEQEALAVFSSEGNPNHPDEGGDTPPPFLIVEIPWRHG